ncbi:RrF2 family transcriptional regulator [Cohnella candidum]|nr:Rrf2 family transcriptional regulator [Cohnella candidum]
MAPVKSQSSLTPTAFGLAIQALVFLSASDNVCPSQQIAQNMKSGTTFMRRMMSPLVRAGLVEAREGRDGGYILAQPADRITVADVYRAVQMSDPLKTGLLESTTDCPNGQAVKSVFREMTDQTENSMLEIYARYTIADIAARAAASLAR